MRKGVSPFLSAVLYVGIVLSALTIVVQMGTPIMQEMRDTNRIDLAKDELSSLDFYIREVASEGQGSVRTMKFEVPGGALKVDATNEKVQYELETDADVISPRVRKKIGNVYLRSNANVDVTANATHYIMKNDRINVTFRRIAQASPESMTTEGIIDYFGYVEDGATLTGTINVYVDGTTATNTGLIWTEAYETGADLGFGKITANVDSAVDYNITYILESNADFLTIEVSAD